MFLNQDPLKIIYSNKFNDYADDEMDVLVELVDI